MSVFDRDLLVDLSGVEFMGSATVRIINRARESLLPSPWGSTLRSPSRRVRRVLDLYGLADQLDPHSGCISSAVMADSMKTGRRR